MITDNTLRPALSTFINLVRSVEFLVISWHADNHLVPALNQVNH